LGKLSISGGEKDSNAENKVWSDSAPRELISWVNDSSAFGEYATQKLYQFRRLVRYLKRWRNFKFSHDVSRKIYSIGLTVMIKQHFRPSIDSEGCPNDLIALKDTVNSILNWSGYFISYPDDQWKVQVSLPVSPYRDIFHGSSFNRYKI
jgi:hypothetical protein